MKKKEFTVIATSFNDEDEIENYLDAIQNQSLIPYECIIVDGGSFDRTIEVVNNYKYRLKYPIKIISSGRLNIAQGYNLAIRNVETEIIIITGIGNTYDSKYFEQLINDYDKDADIVYGPIIGKNSTFFARIYNKAYLRGKKGWGSFLPSNRGVLINKHMFEIIGYFDENFIYAGEDTEFFLRARNSGLRFRYNIHAKLYWNSPQNFKEHIRKRNAYMIGDIQCGMYKKQVTVSIISYLLIGGVFLCITQLWIYCLLFLLVVTLAIRIQTWDLFAIGLRVLDIFGTLFLFLINIKYLAPQYRLSN